VKAFLKKTSGGLLMANNDETADYIDRLKIGQVVVTDIKKARNPEQHKRYFSFLNATFEMQDHFETLEQYRKWIAMKAGFYTAIVAPNGNTFFVAESISFENMDEDKFLELFSSSIDIFLKELGKGVSESDLMRVIDYG